MEIDVTQALKDTENALRDFIASVLTKKFGAEWIDKCGVTPERIEKWQESKKIEEKRQQFGTVEERLIYYAEFYDLKTILEKQWELFGEALGKKRTMEVWLDELGRFRDPDAHRRELLPHHKHLAVGIAGEIRTRLVRYRSKQETIEDFFSMIESARDSFGNLFLSLARSTILTEIILRPNDVIDFAITASDPFGDQLEYGIRTQVDRAINWQKDNSFSVRILESHIRKSFMITLYIRSPRKHHAYKDYDDYVEFVYQVLPSKSK